MKTDLVQTAFVAISLVILAALQDMSPSWAGGAKAPLVQVFALYAALADPSGLEEKRPRAPRSFRWAWTAAAAGYLMESLSGLPPFSCIGFLVPACALAHMLRTIARPDLAKPFLGMAAAAAYAPLQEVWLAAWSAGGDSPVVRALTSILLAALAGATLFSILPVAERFAGLRKEAQS